MSMWKKSNSSVTPERAAYLLRLLENPKHKVERDYYLILAFLVVSVVMLVLVVWYFSTVRTAPPAEVMALAPVAIFGWAVFLLASLIALALLLVKIEIKGRLTARARDIEVLDAQEDARAALEDLLRTMKEEAFANEVRARMVEQCAGPGMEETPSPSLIRAALTCASLLLVQQSGLIQIGMNSDGFPNKVRPISSANSMNAQRSGD